MAAVTTPGSSSLRADTALRQALAIAIVRAKRAREREAAEWRAKAQRLEAALQQQQASSRELEAWARNVLTTIYTNSVPLSAQQQHDELPQQGQVQTGCTAAATDDSHAGVITQPVLALPPLAQHHAQSDWHGSSHSTQQQGDAAHEGQQLQPLPPAAQAANAQKAAALSQMLLTNVRMLQRLQEGTGGAFQDLEAQENSNATIAAFITNTLIKVPPSSLRTAYIHQCAGVLNAAIGKQQHAGVTVTPSHKTAQAGLQQPAGDDAAVVLHLIHHLFAATTQLQQRGHGPQQGQHNHFHQQAANTSAADHIEQVRSTPSPAETAAAWAMLHELACLPASGVLVLQGCAETVQQLCRQLVAGEQLMQQPGTSEEDVWQALVHNALLFQRAHQLMTMLDNCIQRLPAYASTLTVTLHKSLASTVAACLDAYGTMPVLNDSHPLLVAAVMQSCAMLATSLQHVATSQAIDSTLKGVCTRLCIRLRDTFMPGGGT